MSSLTLMLRTGECELVAKDADPRPPLDQGQGGGGQCVPESACLTPYYSSTARVYQSRERVALAALPCSLPTLPSHLFASSQAVLQCTPRASTFSSILFLPSSWWSTPLAAGSAQGQTRTDTPRGCTVLDTARQYEPMLPGSLPKRPGGTSAMLLFLLVVAFASPIEAGQFVMPVWKSLVTARMGE